ISLGVSLARPAPAPYGIAKTNTDWLLQKVRKFLDTTLQRTGKNTGACSCAAEQHKEMLAQACAECAITPDMALDVMQPGQSLAGLPDPLELECTQSCAWCAILPNVSICSSLGSDI
ncbi:MAG: hypothetical protein LBM00_09665, partial [Deltaproteobacteria bacterium]|nr:hypothetical protein [Deltaproteobacteria bacterium]